MLNKRKVIAIAGMLLLTVMGLLFFGGCLSPDPTVHDDIVPALFIRNLTLTKGSTSLNGSFNLQNCDGRVINITAFRLNDITLDKINGLAVYVNGTLIDYLAAPQLFSINPDDTASVTMTVLYEHNLDLIGTFRTGYFEVNVKTPYAQFWRDTTYP
jgi:hypothetical protein